ncbi:hypothetical protein [uncultured Pseudokineococcus sp.]|uniref:hypothetical protein n=1 Tax=uncultured Pseudokineococcus sp. TaxID=1642928 RepID=UPI00262DBDF4|nr:hypothetical protein [uncultured Pseudokineococcus sp.]
MSEPQDRRGGLPATDLAGAFGRTSGLASRLGPGRGAGSQQAPAEAPPQDQGDEQDAPLAGQDQPPATGDDARPAGAGTDSNPAGGRAGRDRRGAVVIYTSTALRQRINDHLERTGARNADLLFDALEATAEELPQLWAESLRSPHAQGRSLFSRDSAPQRSGVEPQISWYVAMSPANQAVLDDLVKQVTGGSSRKRSALVVLALSTYLARREADG